MIAFTLLRMESSAAPPALIMGMLAFIICIFIALTVYQLCRLPSFFNQIETLRKSLISDVSFFAKRLFSHPVLRSPSQRTPTQSLEYGFRKKDELHRTYIQVLKLQTFRLQEKLASALGKAFQHEPGLPPKRIPQNDPNRKASPSPVGETDAVTKEQTRGYPLSEEVAPGLLARTRAVWQTMSCYTSWRRIPEGNIRVSWKCVSHSLK